MNMKKILFIIITICIFRAIINYPIFQCFKSTDEIDFKKIKNNYPDCDILICEHSETTGSGWIGRKADSDKNLEMGIVISTPFDPRFLKDNNELEMDMFAKYIIISKKQVEDTYENESVLKVFPEKILVLYDSDEEYYRVKDMSLSGLVKFFGGLFIKKLSLSV